MVFTALVVNICPRANNPHVISRASTRPPTLAGAHRAHLRRSRESEERARQKREREREMVERNRERRK
jgi:hypothetical protein